MSSTDPAAADPAGSARQRNRPVVAADGYPRLQERQQPDPGLHDEWRRAGRRPGLDLEFQLAGNAERQFAVERQSGEILRRHDHLQTRQRRGHRHDREQLDQFRADRRRRHAARQDAGPGPDPGRSAGGVDVERAVGQDHGRHRRARRARAEGGVRPRSVQRAAGQYDQSDLHRYGHQHPASGHDRARRRSHRAAAVESRRQSEQPGDRRQFHGRNGLRRRAIEHRARRRQPAILQSGRIDAARGGQRHQCGDRQRRLCQRRRFPR